MIKYCNKLIASQSVSFNTIKPKSIPDKPGIYLITLKKGNIEIPFYVGRTQNLKRRIYTNHLMGSPTNARLKNYLINDIKLKDIVLSIDAKNYIKINCFVRWIEEEVYSNDLPTKARHAYQVRGLLESFVTSELFPRYGIYKEH